MHPISDIGTHTLLECFWEDFGRTAFLESGMWSHSVNGKAAFKITQVDDDGESYWVFESRDVTLFCVYTGIYVDITLLQPSRPANPVDSK